MSRDMSADTTLDNANMGTREDFEKQARLLDSARREGWAHRQPEIDALKAENERLRVELSLRDIAQECLDADREEDAAI